MDGLFETVVCGLDESPVALETLGQAQRLLDSRGRLMVMSAIEERVPVAPGGGRRPEDDHLGRALRDGLAYAAEHYGSETLLAHGNATQSVVEAARRERADLVVVGARGGSRAGGLVLGHTAIGVVRKSPCSVLVVRTPRMGLEFPSSIVVGVDGSDPSLRALETGRHLGRRFGSPVRGLIARGDGVIASSALRRVEDLEWTDEKAVEALTTASAGADLVVVGSRGLHGVATLGSVSERVVQRAYSSVLVVRDGRVP